MKFLSLLSLIFMLATSALAQRKNAGVIAFDCSRMPEVCTNMCFGVHCRSRRYSRTMTYDWAKATVKSFRRTSAGCGRAPGNRCISGNNQGKGLSCDEFPFASSRQADQLFQISRCVPYQQNNRQGLSMTGLPRMGGRVGSNKINRIPFDYNIAFLNPLTPGVRHCRRGVNACQPDNNLLISGKFQAKAPGIGWTPKTRRQEATAEGELAQFRLKSGALVAAPKELQPGDKIFHTVINATMEAKVADNTGDEDDIDFDEMYGDSVDLAEDEVDHLLTEAELASEIAKAEANSA